VNSKFCFEKCSIGKAASDVYLDLNNSAIDAALDFDTFTDNCFKTCPYKSEHKNINTNKED
jgi:hypothetical protein